MPREKVSYTEIDSPIGPLLVAATQVGLIRVVFDNGQWDAALEDLGRRVGPVVEGRAPLAAVLEQLDEYFDGQRQEFTIDVDLRLANGFRRTALEHLRTIPYGETESYAEVAEAAGSPRAMRAVGSACANNPIPLVIPCHRVVRSDGTLGGYGGGLKIKSTLLEMEEKAAAAK
ncbi:MAG TPA: methylated-DNA--[protein]-cysteine S-methyltransferase [Actinomycetales bacterium]|nr:methylated-DNA--[protein]-cysteine S-methyltransferase [Actinomycetales bacterium]